MAFLAAKHGNNDYRAISIIIPKSVWAISPGLYTLIGSAGRQYLPPHKPSLSGIRRRGQVLWHQGPHKCEMKKPYHHHKKQVANASTVNSNTIFKSSAYIPHCWPFIANAFCIAVVCNYVEYLRMLKDFEHGSGNQGNYTLFIKPVSPCKWKIGSSFCYYCYHCIN